jgi:hypothetical protein
LYKLFEPDIVAKAVTSWPITENALKKPDHHDLGKKKFEGPTAPVEP